MSQAGLFISGAHPVSPIETLTGNSGGPVGPDGAGNINVIGATGINIVGTPINNTLTVNLTGVLFNYTNVNFAASPYTVLSTDYYISVDSSGGGITIELPNTTTSNRVFIIKDRTGNASSNNIVITTVGGLVTIDGQTIYIMNNNFEAVTLLFNGVGYEIF